MATEITQQVKDQTVVTFWVKEDTKSPYQGILFYNADDYSKLSAEDIQTHQMKQFGDWKVTTAKAQADQEGK